MYPELSEEERFPILTQAGRQLLYRMRQHSSAPVWNWPNGEQLNHAGLARVKRFAQQLGAEQPSSIARPAWLGDYVEKCLNEVPFYRKRSRVGTSFDNIPTCSREDLASGVWEFVPDSEPLDELIVFSSSGTTGRPTRTPHHPYSAACGVPLIEYAIDQLHGVKLKRGADQVAITNVAAYRGAYTTAIVVSCLEEAGCVRVNLDPSAWRREEDRTQYINEWKAPVWLGDPVAYGAMERLEFDHSPQVIVSSIMHLSDAYSDQLRKRYGCPVVDLYAMTEAGIIAAREQHGHRILPHDLYVEILGDNDEPVTDGMRGEVTLTGGRNPYLPLLRYRTGDFASLEWIDGKRILVGLEGRHPVQYRSSHGRIVHSMEVTRLMRRHPVQRYSIGEVSDGRYKIQVLGDVYRMGFVKEVEELFGSAAEIEFE